MGIVLTHDPLDELYLTSYFGMRNGVMHKGADFGWWGDNWEDINIYAAASGEVCFCGYGENGYGYYIILQHNGFCTLYAHMSAFIVSEGESVASGESIGKMGQSGNAAGAHLHFEVRLGSYSDYFDTEPSDPMNFLPVVQSGEYVTYTVQSGDTLSAIAARYGVSVSLIVETNAISNPNLIYPGQILKITLLPQSEEPPVINEPKEEIPLSVGDMVRITAAYASSAYADRADNTAAIGWERLILGVNEGANFPFRVGNGGVTTGYFKKEALLGAFT